MGANTLLADLFRTRPLDESTPRNLNKVLTRLDLTFAGIGAMIGSGIFVLIGVCTAKAGPSVVLSITMAGILAMCSALCYSEFASFIPSAGSAYIFVYTVGGELPAWMIGWTAVLEFNVGVAAISRGWAGYTMSLLTNFDSDEMHHALQYDIPGTPLSLSFIAPAAVLLVVVITTIGINESSKSNIILCSIKMFVLLAVFCGGITVGDTSSITEVDFFPNAAGATIAAAATLSFAYSGFDSVSMLAEEAINPTRDLPWAILSACLIATILYMMSAFALVLLVRYDKVDKDAPFSQAFAERDVQWMSTLVGIGAFTGITSALLMAQVGACRQWYALSRDGLLPGWMAKIHSTYKTPARANVFSGGFSAAMAALLDLEQLANLLAVGTLFSFASVASCLLLLRYNFKSKVKISLSMLWVLSIILGCLAAYHTKGRIRVRNEVFAVIGGLILETWIYISYQKRVMTPAKFVVPLGPIVPLASIFGNIFVMMGLGWTVAIRFFGWLLIGMIIYFRFGRHGSNLAPGNEDRAALITHDPA